MSDSDVSGPCPARPVRVTEQLKQKMIAERLSGVPVSDIAKRYHYDRVTVWRVCNAAQRHAAGVTDSWRAEQIAMAVDSINRALLDETDVYKSAAIGDRALKGLGVYAPDGQNTAAIVVANMPLEVRELALRYSADSAEVRKPNTLDDDHNG